APDAVPVIGGQVRSRSTLVGVYQHGGEVGRVRRVLILHLGAVVALARVVADFGVVVDGVEVRAVVRRVPEDAGIRVPGNASRPVVIAAVEARGGGERRIAVRARRV